MAEVRLPSRGRLHLVTNGHEVYETPGMAGGGESCQPALLQS
jgi:hypothetical protein